MLVLSRSTGVDLTTGAGLDLDGVDAVVDATNVASLDLEEILAFFGSSTRTLLAAERAAGVGHHVLLSILAVDPETPNPHQQGKLHQAALVREGGVPCTILQAPQFFEFADLVVSWTRSGDEAVVPPVRVRAAAGADVGVALAHVALDAPLNRERELVGPEIVDLADVARRSAAARGDDALTVRANWEGAPIGEHEPDEPAPERSGGERSARDRTYRAPTTLDAWLATLR